MIVAMLAPSCSALPAIESQSDDAADSPMSDAAGIVVTLISTPISAPDLAVVSDSVPAAPAQKATMNV